MSEESQNRDIADAIMTRRFELDGGHVGIYVWAPIEDFQDYPRCNWRIVGMGDGKLRRSTGVDTVDAVSEALKVIGTILYNSDEWLDGRLTWLGMRNLGLASYPAAQDR